MTAPLLHNRPLWRSTLTWLVVALALMAVFMLYTRPDFLMLMVDQVWSCF